MTSRGTGFSSLGILVGMGLGGLRPTINLHIGQKYSNK